MFRLSRVAARFCRMPNSSTHLSSLYRLSHYLIPEGTSSACRAMPSFAPDGRKSRVRMDLSMTADLEQVSRLQTLDLRIAELRKEIAALPKHIAGIEKALDSHNRRLEADRAALSANQKDRKRLEDDTKVHDQKISKLKDQMLQAKTNEQYRAFQNEIDYAAREIRKAEDRILDLMGESEPLEANVKRAEAELKKE